MCVCVCVCVCVTYAGIHSKGWSVEEAISYMMLKTGMHRHECEAECYRSISLTHSLLSPSLSLSLARSRAISLCLSLSLSHTPPLLCVCVCVCL